MSCEPAGSNTHACSIEYDRGTCPSRAQGRCGDRVVHHQSRDSVGRLVYKFLSSLGTEISWPVRSESFVHVVLDALCEHDPHDAHDLIRERDDRLVLSSSCHKVLDPSTLRMRVFVGPAHSGASTMDEQHSQRAITVLGDTAELNATARAVLSWH